MSHMRTVAKLFALCFICVVASLARETTELGMSTAGGMTVDITSLDVNDSTLTLSYDIKNDSDHEAWICSESGPPFEVFLALDTQTLVIRKRMDVPDNSTRDRGAPVGTYVRIVPGASLTESVRITLPVAPRITYSVGNTTEVTQTVERLALEIGYFDEDLPAMIHSICAIADTCDLPHIDISLDTFYAYFRGVAIRNGLGNYFDRVNPDPYGEGHAHICYSRYALIEKILRADVNDVSIPYKGHAVINYCD